MGVSAQSKCGKHCLDEGGARLTQCFVSSFAKCFPLTTHGVSKAEKINKCQTVVRKKIAPL
jgi:hypothetical protein